MVEENVRRSVPRIRVFVDYWNLQITLNDKEGTLKGQKDYRFQINWRDFPSWVAGEAAKVAKLADFTYEGAIIYASYNPNSDPSFRRWMTTWLDRQPGIQVIALERRPKMPPTCPSCHTSMENCPNCGNKVVATSEKGVDTALVTDMIRLAWEDAYDIGVIVSSDSDFVPVVQFLDSRSRKIIQAGFPPTGMHLATACWGSLDLFPLREHFRRT